MLKHALSGMVTVAILTRPAFAQATAGDFRPAPDWIVFALSLFLAAWWSAEAFDRPSVKLAGMPTLPRYMTPKEQYRLGKALFVILYVGLYCLMIYYHRHLPWFVDQLGMKEIAPELSAGIKNAIESDSNGYIIIIASVSMLYVALLRIEREGNLFLLGRDMIYSWVSVPHLANKIAALSKEALVVPPAAQIAISQKPSGWKVDQVDFQKNARSLDRAWAELCYINSWIHEQQLAQRGSTFFSEKSFAWQQLSARFDELKLMVVALKTGLGTDGCETPVVMAAVEEHREKLGRLVACYLVFMNSARPTLAASAREFGIELDSAATANPLWYSAIYISALAISVYLGVFFSAVAYDSVNGTGLLRAIGSQEGSDAQRWVIFALGCYGVPIIGILLHRNIAWRRNPVRSYSIAVSYAWILAFGAILSALGLTLVVMVAGKAAGHWPAFFQILGSNLKWSIGPALICVYISHCLDRQVDPRAAVNGLQRKPVPVRILHTLLFTLAVMVLTLPSILTISGAGATWPVTKLRVVSLGTVFWVTLILSLVAQFTVRRRGKPAATNLEVLARS